MQLAGARFTDPSAIFGNDLSTFPNFPAEIRAPAGTLPGVSSFQVHIADRDILTPGDQPDVLVAMNPAALKDNLADLAPAGTIVINSDAFDERNLARAGYPANPIEDGSLDSYRVLSVPMEDLTKQAVEGSGLKGRGVLRSKNFFALGLMAWMFNRPIDTTLEWIAKYYGKEPDVKAANELAFRAGYNLGESTEMFWHTYTVPPAEMPPGTYTNVTGNQALAWGIIAAGQAARLPVMYASYPITPASDILHELARHRNFGVRTFQAEDEIAAAGAALGASFAGHLGVTGTSGPGLALKSETISLAIMTELPMLIIDVDSRRRRRTRRLVRRPPRRHRDQRPRPRPQERNDQPRHHDRAAHAHHRCATRRAVHRSADQDRTGRPAHGDVRAPRRVAAADRRPRHAGRCLRGRHRSGPDRPQVHDPGDPALRRLHRDEHRAVAASRPRQPARHQRAVHRGAQWARCHLPPLPARRQDAGPALGGARYPRPGASPRGIGEGRRRQCLVHAREPRPDDPAARGQDPRDRRRHPRRRGRRR